MKTEGRRHILIRSPNWLGDALMMTPVLHRLREALPEARLTVLAHPWVGALFSANPEVDEVIHYQKPGIHEGWRGRRRLARLLKEKGFDATLLFPHSFESAWIAFWGRIPIRIGYAVEGRGLLLTHPLWMGREGKRTHQVAHFFRLLEPLGIRERPDPKRHPLRIHLPREAQERAARLLESLGVTEKETLIGMAPGARYGSAKCWPFSRFRRLAEALTKNGLGRVIFLGTEKDALSGKEDERSECSTIYDLSGKTDLPEALALIQRCRLFISNDSGLMHGAAALNIPLIALFGPTDPERTGPWGGKYWVIRKDLPCWPCRKEVCRRRPTCMEAIEWEEVYEAALAALSDASRRPG